MSDKKQEMTKTVPQEMYEFLLKLERASAARQKNTKKKDDGVWSQIFAPSFRNFKVFVNDDTNELIIAIPTHISNSEDVSYHVIRESMSEDAHNGYYEMLSAENFENKYECEYIETNVGQQPMRINDMAEAMVKNLSEIKKLKNDTPANTKIAINYIGKKILEFMMGLKH